LLEAIEERSEVLEHEFETIFVPTLRRSAAQRLPGVGLEQNISLPPGEHLRREWGVRDEITQLKRLRSRLERKQADIQDLVSTGPLLPPS
jgi:hypothetical protein